jgi:HK97 gp10 family phage protein
MPIRISVDGLQQVRNAFEKLTGEQQTEAMKTAFERGANTIATLAKGFAPVKSGLLRESIQVKTTRRLGNVYTRVVISQGWYKGDQFYAAFQEFGYHHGSRKLGNAREWVPGKKFMRTAVQMTEGVVPAQICKDICDAIDRYAAELKGSS